MKEEVMEVERGLDEGDMVVVEEKDIMGERIIRR